MKKFLLVTLLFQTLSVFADDITIAPFKIKTGETKTVEVLVENTNNLPGDQPTSCVIALPDGLNWEGANASATQTSRLISSGYSSYVVNKNNVLKLSNLSAKIDAGNGALWTFKITASATFEGGDIQISSKVIGGVKFSDSTTKVEVEEEAPARTEVMYISDFSIEKGKTKTVEVILNNAEDYPGNQPTSCVVALSDGLTWEGTNANAANTSRLVASGYSSYVVNKNNVLKLSNLSAQINAGTGALWTFQIKAAEDFEGGKMTISSIVTNGVKQPDVEVTVTATPGTGIDAISTVESNDAVVYDLAGRRVNANAKGLLIKGGKKYVVK